MLSNEELQQLKDFTDTLLSKVSILYDYLCIYEIEIVNQFKKLDLILNTNFKLNLSLSKKDNCTQLMKRICDEYHDVVENFKRLISDYCDNCKILYKSSKNSLSNEDLEELINATRDELYYKPILKLIDCKFTYIMDNIINRLASIDLDKIEPNNIDNEKSLKGKRYRKKVTIRSMPKSLDEVQSPLIFTAKHKASDRYKMVKINQPNKFEQIEYVEKEEVEQKENEPLYLGSNSF